MKGSWQIVVHRPIADVFDFLADIRNETAWNPRVIHIDQVSAGPIGRDTVFRGRYQALGTLLAPVMNPLVKRQNAAAAATRLKQVLDDGRAALTGRTTGRTEDW
jgi:hypothetical protein